MRVMLCELHNVEKDRAKFQLKKNLIRSSIELCGGGREGGGECCL